MKPVKADPFGILVPAAVALLLLLVLWAAKAPSGLDACEQDPFVATYREACEQAIWEEWARYEMSSNPPERY